MASEFFAPTFYPFLCRIHKYIRLSVNFAVAFCGGRIWCFHFVTSNNKQTNTNTRESNTRESELQKNCATEVKQAKSIVMPFSESHFSRAQWLFYMIVAFSCLRSVMLLKWNQKRPIFVHFLRNYSVIRDVCCYCYCHCCRCFCFC